MRARDRERDMTKILYYWKHSLVFRVTMRVFILIAYLWLAAAVWEIVDTRGANWWEAPTMWSLWLIGFLLCVVFMVSTAIDYEKGYHS